MRAIFLLSYTQYMPTIVFIIRLLSFLSCYIEIWVNIRMATGIHQVHGADLNSVSLNNIPK